MTDDETQEVTVARDAELCERIKQCAVEQGVSPPEMTHRLLIAGINYYPAERDGDEVIS